VSVYLNIRTEERSKMFNVAIVLHLHLQHPDKRVLLLSLSVVAHV
jgi:hypothetical protein